MTEFSENLALAADVYVSTRRLEGVHRDAANTEKRIRQIAQVRCDQLRIAGAALAPS